MIEKKDVQISSKHLYDFIAVKIMTLESYLHRSDCPLDSTEKTQYRTIIEDSKELMRKIKTIAHIL